MDDGQSHRLLHRRRFFELIGATTVGSLGVGSASAKEATNAATPPSADLTSDYAVERTDVSINSFDGTTIETTVFEPVPDGAYPAIIATHGWGGSRDQNDGEGMAYAAGGYVLLTFDSRGFGESEGEVGVDGPKEVRDVAALIDYLASHPKVRTDVDGDPQVGMLGGSYAGGIQLNAAAYDDRIDAIVPEICWNDLNYALQPNGVVKTAWGAGLYGVGAAGAREHELRNGDVAGIEEGMDPQVHRAFAEGVALNGYSEESEAYFAVRSPVYKMNRIDTPTLLIQGWTDHLFVPTEAVRNFQALRDRGIETRLLFYNDGHEQIPVDGDYPQAVDVSDEARRAWLDAHLKRGRAASYGRRRLDELLPGAVTYYASQDGTLRSADGMPPSGATIETVVLADAVGTSGEQSVVLNGPATSNSYLVQESYDVPGTSASFDLPAETLGATDGRVEILGVPTLDLQVQPLGSEAYLFAKLYHVATDGSVTHIDDQVTPISLTADPDSAWSFQSVSFDLVALQCYLASGDRLRLTIAGSDSAFNDARQAAGAAVGHDSSLSLPIRVLP